MLFERTGPPKAVRLRLEIKQSPCHSAGCVTAQFKRGLRKNDGSQDIFEGT